MWSSMTATRAMRHRPDGPAIAAPDVPVACRARYASRDDRPRGRALATIDDWGADHRGRVDRSRRAAWSPPAAMLGTLVSLGVGDQARDGAGRPDRGGAGAARSRRAGRSARVDRPTPARPRVGAPVRGVRPSSRHRGRGGSTRIRGSTPSAPWSGSGRVCRSTTVLASLGPRATRDGRHDAWSSGRRRVSMARSATSPRLRAELLRPTLIAGGRADRRDDGRVPGPRRGRARGRAVRPVRLGPRVRAA